MSGTVAPVIDVGGPAYSPSIPVGDSGSEYMRSRVSRDKLRKGLIEKGYSEAGADGILQNLMRESGNDPSATGDGGTSFGLAQWHNSRKSDLEAYAKEHKKSAADPEVQLDFLDQEMRSKFPRLRERMVAATDAGAAEDAFKRIYERPASVMWQNGAGGEPVMATDRYRFSPYALAEHDGKRNIDLLMMNPQDYLDLSPDMEGEPFASKSGRALRASFDSGDPIEAVPSLDMRVKDGGGTVTAQDGRHRALLARQEGIEQMPVAVRRIGDKGPVNDVEGLSGKLLPFDFQPARKPGGGLLDALIPRASATEPAGKWWQGAIPDQPAGSSGLQWWKGAIPDAAAPSGGDTRSIPQRIGQGLGNAVEGGAQLLSDLTPAPIERGINAANNFIADKTGLLAKLPPGGMDQAVQQREAAIAAQRGGDTGTDWWRMAGDVANPVNYLMPELRGGSLAARMGSSALQGGLAAALQPVTTGGNMLAEKAKQMLLGGLTGGAVRGAGGVASNMIAPRLRDAAQTLMDAGVRLTPGQMGGRAAKAVEDKARSIPITGDAIAAAQRRSFDDFNRAAWNRALEPLGETVPKNVKMGRDASDYVSDRISAAYSAILPNLSVRVDAPFVQDLQNIVAQYRGSMPDPQFKQFENIARAQILGKLGNVGTSSDGQLINGIDSMLGTEARGYRSDQLFDNRKLGHAIEELQVSFRDMLERQNPAHAGELKKAREAFANYVRVSEAGASTGTANTEGIFSPAQLNSAVRAEDSSVRKSGYSKGKALLQDLSDAGMAVLPSKYPDSGTAGRMLLAGGTFEGANYLHHPEAMLALLAGAVPYTKLAMSGANALLRAATQPAGPVRNALSAIPETIGRAIAPGIGAAGSQATQGAAYP